MFYYFLYLYHVDKRGSSSFSCRNLKSKMNDTENKPALIA